MSILITDGVGLELAYRFAKPNSDICHNYTCDHKSEGKVACQIEGFSVTDYPQYGFGGLDLCPSCQKPLNKSGVAMPLNG